MNVLSVSYIMMNFVLQKWIWLLLVEWILPSFLQKVEKICMVSTMEEE